MALILFGASAPCARQALAELAVAPSSSEVPIDRLLVLGMLSTASPSAAGAETYATEVVISGIWCGLALDRLPEPCAGITACACLGY